MRTSGSYPDLVEEELKKYDGEVCKYFQVDRRSSMVSLSEKICWRFFKLLQLFRELQKQFLLGVPDVVSDSGNHGAKDHFTILQKCKNKLYCLLYEMLYIRDLEPVLNT